MGKLLAMRGRGWGGLQVWFYRLASHFFPFDDFSHTMKAMAKTSTTMKNIVK